MKLFLITYFISTCIQLLFPGLEYDDDDDDGSSILSGHLETFLPRKLENHVFDLLFYAIRLGNQQSLSIFTTSSAEIVKVHFRYLFIFVNLMESVLNCDLFIF